MNNDREALTQERLELDLKYREYIARHGFNYREYIAPSRGSFTDRYKQRIAAIDAVLSPALKDPDEKFED